MSIKNLKKKKLESSSLNCPSPSDLIYHEYFNYIINSLFKLKTWLKLN